MNLNIKLITNSEDQTYELIRKNLKECKSFKFNVAFISWGGYQILVQTFDEINNKNIQGKILTTTYQTFTDPKVLKSLTNFKNFEIKIIDEQTIKNSKINDSFHPKGYIFEFENHYNVLIGSVNMTEKAMKTNVEWSFLVEFKKDDEELKNILDEFDFLWNNTNNMSEEFFLTYKELFEKRKLLISTFEKNNLKLKKEIKPNHIQQQALTNLKNLRNQNQSKALVIAATGVGKTYLSAFDVKQFNSKKTLFIVHREEILNNAKQTYENILENKITLIFKGTQKETSADIIFASQQTLHKNLDLFKKDEFDYIIIDEAHHAYAETYFKIINYFKPKFLLGMTATPERMDGENVWDLFGNNIAIEVRLKDAINEGIVTSFHYFGITDLDTIDLSKLDIDKDIDKIAKKLMVNERVDFIIEKMNLYQYDGIQMNCLAFCANIEHAKFMCKEFNERGIVSKYIIGETPSEERKEIIKKFQDDNDSLQVIFTVDIFNEGVDIPKINLVLFLRPTNSPIIFLQQLGRGLRKNDNKTFLTVLDFIANHNKTYLIPYAIASFNNQVNELYVRDIVKENFKALSEFHIEFDSIAKERILDSFSKVNIYSEKWIKNEYIKFKQILKRIPKYMCDYLIEGAPDVLKICRKYENYLCFLSKIENDKQYFDLLQNEKFKYYINWLNKMLPIYRINEFILILEVIKNNVDEISFDRAKEIINLYTPNTSDWSIEHTFDFFDEKFNSKNEKFQYKFFNVIKNNLIINDDFKQIINSSLYKEFIIDCLEYGIRNFINNYNLEKYKFPFIKLWKEYRMKEILSINQSERSISSLYGSGVWCFKEFPNEYYFFLDLQSDNKYKNKILSNKYIEWYSQLKESHNSSWCSKIKQEKSSLHLFARKQKQINNITQPYFYISKAKVIKQQGDNPIRFKLELETPLSNNLLDLLKER